MPFRELASLVLEQNYLLLLYEINVAAYTTSLTQRVSCLIVA